MLFSYFLFTIYIILSNFPAEFKYLCKCNYQHAQWGCMFPPVLILEIYFEREHYALKILLGPKTLPCVIQNVTYSLNNSDFVVTETVCWSLTWCSSELNVRYPVMFKPLIVRIACFTIHFKNKRTKSRY